MSKLSYQFTFALLLLSLVAVSTRAQDKAQDEKETPKKEQNDEPETMQEIRQAIAAAQSEILKEYRKVKPGTPEQRAILARYYGASDKFVDKIIAAVDENPKDSVAVNMLMSIGRMSRNNKVKSQANDTLFEVAKSRLEENKKDRMATNILLTVLQGSSKMKQDEAVSLLMELVEADPKSDNSFNMLSSLATGTFIASIKEKAQTMLLENFGDSEKMGDFAMGFARAAPSPANIKILKELLEKSEHDSVKGPATYAMAKLLLASAKTKEEGVKMLKSIPDKYPDVKVYRGRRNLAKMVAGEIFEQERLQIGMEVPDIEGEDVDGVKFKLSEYRGKVVVIDFWGDW